ncbi:MAG: gas vesicle protein [Acidobacteriota bacterium]
MTTTSKAIGEPSGGVQLASDTSLCDLLDRVLDRGIVLEGDLVLSVAGVDLVYLRLEALLASVSTAIEAGAFPASAPGAVPPRSAE